MGRMSAPQALVVQKFGGTSVGSPERICAVADRIAAAWSAGAGLVVVVSAMGDTTDELIGLAHQISKSPPHREMDMLLTVGERVSMALLSMALVERGVPAISFTGSQSGIITDESHSRARIRRILGDRVRQAVAQGKVAIVAGFQGVSETKEITTLGRGGSDTTAVAMAAVLKADRCDIYTDVDGVFTADPRKVPGARLLPQVPHDLMVELATRGAGVLHPRSVELAKQFGVRLRVLNSLKAENHQGHSEGTTIMKADTAGMEDFNVTGITADSDRCLLSIQLQRPTVTGAVMDFARERHLSLVTPVFMGSRLEFFIARAFQDEWKKGLERLLTDGFLKTYEIQEQVAPVSVVGNRFSQDGAALQEVIEILARQNISITMASGSPLAITVAVAANRADDAVRALHETLIEGSPKGTPA